MKAKKIPTKEPGVFKWEISFHLDGRGSKRLRRRFDKKADAELFIEEFQKQQRLQKLGGASLIDLEKTTLRTEAEYWLGRRKPMLSPSSYARVAGCLKAELLPRYGDLQATRFTVAKISEIQNEILRAGKAPRTVNREVGMIKAILNFSASHQRLPYNPALHAKPLSAARVSMKFWEPADARAFLRFASDKYPVGHPRRWVFVAYLLAVNTGMRSGELWGLQPKDFQGNRSLIHVARQFDYYARTLRPCKGKSERYVPCNPAVRQEVELLIAQGKLKPDSLLFTGKTGEPVEDHSFKRHFFRIDLKESKARPIRFHDLRHTAATLMIAGGVDLPTVQAILDHKHISTTMLYVHLLGDSIQKVAGSFAVLPDLSPLNIG